MSRVLEFWSLPTGERERLAPPPVPVQAGPPAVESLPAPAADAAADRTVETVRGAGRWLGCAEHTEAQSAWFRHEVLDGPVARALGTVLAEHLVGRPLAGPGGSGPALGWVTNDELREAAARLSRLGGDPLAGLDGARASAAGAVLAAVLRAADAGTDLVTAYL